MSHRLQTISIFVPIDSNLQRALNWKNHWNFFFPHNQKQDVCVYIHIVRSDILTILVTMLNENGWIPKKEKQKMDYTKGLKLNLLIIDFRALSYILYIEFDFFFSFLISNQKFIKIQNNPIHNLINTRKVILIYYVRLD